MYNEKHLKDFIWFFKIEFWFQFPGETREAASLVAQIVKQCNAGDLVSIPRLGRAPGEGNDNPLQYPCLENPMDQGTW